jgi:hypothetical protein
VLIRALKHDDRYGEPEILSEGIEIRPPALVPEDKVYCDHIFLSSVEMFYRLRSERI